MDIVSYSIAWDLDQARGVVKLYGDAGTPLPSGSQLITDAAKFTAVVALLEGSAKATWDPSNKRIIAGREALL